MQHVIHILRSLKEESELMSIWMKPQGCRICDRKVRRTHNSAIFLETHYKYVITKYVCFKYLLDTDTEQHKPHFFCTVLQ